MSSEGSQSQIPFEVSNHLVCGPRCIEYLQRYYKRPQDDLITIIRETHTSTIDRGATSASIIQKLEESGIHVFPMKIEKNVFLKWSNPVILHLSSTDENEDEPIGHYVVWLPESDSQKSVIWDGLKKEYTLPTEELMRKSSGAVFLTSLEPIDHPQHAIEEYPNHLYNYFLIMIFMAVIFLLLSKSQIIQFSKFKRTST